VQPVLYLDHLLNAHFAPLVEDVPDAGGQVRNVLRRNKQEFIECVDALGVGSLSAIQLHRELQRMVESMDAKLGDTYAPDMIYSTGGLTDMMSAIFARTPDDLQTGFALTDAAIADLLQCHPPAMMMDALGYRSTAELLRREWPRAALALTRATEDPDWQARYKTLLSQRTAEDFEERKIEHLSVDAKRYRAAFMNSKQPPKLWRITHSKEAGVVAALTPDGIAGFRAPLLQYVLVFIHYFFETGFASKYYGYVAARAPERVGAEVVSTIDTHREKLTFFYSNLYSENLFWDRALDLFADMFPSAEMDWFGRARARGEYCLSTGIQNIVVSLNVIDHLWNVNFLSHAGMEAFQHDTIYFLYHFRGALWQEVVNELTGLGSAARERIIVENLGLGDTRLTRQLFDEVRRELSARVTAATS
jgi:hypothetical protein